MFGDCNVDGESCENINLRMKQWLGMFHFDFHRKLILFSFDI